MCWYGIKKWKNVLCLVVVGLLDLRARGQSDVMRVERRRGTFGDLQLSRFLQNGQEESQCGWCVVSSFTSLSFFLRAGVSSLLVLSAFFLISPAVEKFVFDIVFPFWSDQIEFSLFWIGRKITFNYFYFLTNFIITWSYAQDPFSFLKKVSASITSSECSRGR